MFLKRTTVMFIISITMVLVLSKHHWHRDKRGRISGRAVKQSQAPNPADKSVPTAKQQVDPTQIAETAKEFSPFTDIDGRKYLISAELVSNQVAREKCERLKQSSNTAHHSILVLESDEEKEKFLQKYKEKGDSGAPCIWTGSFVNVTANEIRVHIPTPRGRRIRIIPKNDKITGKEIPTRARMNQKNITQASPDGKQNAPPGIGAENGTAAVGRYIAVSQTVFPWIEVVANQTICEFLQTACKPRQCTLVTPPCAVGGEQNCTIKTQPTCITVPDAAGANGTSVCDATCDECAIDQPSCLVQTMPCITEKDRECTISPPACTSITPDCTVELDACTTYQPPCKASHPVDIKDCVFGTNCYVTSGKDADLNCKKIPKKNSTCLPNDTNCAPSIDVCEIPEVCAHPKLCRPPVIHCPTPESFCPPPRITCPPPIVECGQPNITCQEPKVFCPVPTVLCTQPRLNCTAPRISCPIITTICTNPELDCQPININCPEPNLQCEPFTECESLPNIPEQVSIDICVSEACDKSCSCSKVTKKEGPIEEFGDCSDKCATVCEG